MTKKKKRTVQDVIDHLKGKKKVVRTVKAWVLICPGFAKRASQVKNQQMIDEAKEFNGVIVRGSITFTSL